MTIQSRIFLNPCKKGETGPAGARARWSYVSEPCQGPSLILDGTASTPADGETITDFKWVLRYNDLISAPFLTFNGAPGVPVTEPNIGGTYDQPEIDLAAHGICDNVVCVELEITDTGPNNNSMGMCRDETALNAVAEFTSAPAVGLSVDLSGANSTVSANRMFDTAQWDFRLNSHGDTPFETISGPYSDPVSDPNIGGTYMEPELDRQFYNLYGVHVYATLTLTDTGGSMDTAQTDQMEPSITAVAEFLGTPNQGTTLDVTGANSVLPAGVNITNAQWDMRLDSHVGTPVVTISGPPGSVPSNPNVGGTNLTPEFDRDTFGFKDGAHVYATLTIIADNADTDSDQADRMEGDTPTPTSACIYGSWHPEPHPSTALTPDNRFVVDTSRAGDTRLLLPGRSFELPSGSWTIRMDAPVAPAIALPFSFGGWIAPLISFSNAGIITIGSYPDSFRIEGQTTGSLIRISDNAGFIIINIPVTVGEWMHFFVTVSSTEVKAYINGVHYQTAARATTVPAVSKFVVGTDQNNWSDGGKRYDARLYNVELDADQVWDIFTRADDHEANLLGRWLLDEAAGFLSFDSSGNSNDGTILNATSAVHYEGFDVPYSAANDEGVSLGAYTDGTNAYFNTAFGPNLDSSGEIELWFSTSNNTPDRSFIGRLAGGRCAIGGYGTTLIAQLGASDITTSPISNGVPYRVRLSWPDASNFSLYLDESLVGSDTFNGDAGSTIPFYIGALNIVGTPFGNTGAQDTIYRIIVRDAPGGTVLYDTRVDGWGLKEGAARTDIAVAKDLGTPTQDVLGLPLEFDGPAPRSAKLRASHCATFNGTDQYAWSDLSTATALDYPFSLAGWFYVPIGVTGASRPMIGMAGILGFTVSERFNLIFDADNDDVIVGRYDTAGEDTVVYSGVPRDEWHHYCVSFEDATTMAFYFDGVQVYRNTGMTSRLVENTIDRFFIGVIANDNLATPFDGQFCDLRLYQSALTPAQIKNIYDGIDQRPEHHWPCQEGSGSVFGNVGGQNLVANVTNHVDSDVWSNVQDLFHWNYVRGFDVDTSSVTNPDLNGSNAVTHGTIPDDWNLSTNLAVGEVVYDCDTTPGVVRMTFNAPASSGNSGLEQIGPATIGRMHTAFVRFRLVSATTIAANDRVSIFIGGVSEVPHFDLVDMTPGEWVTYKQENVASSNDRLYFGMSNGSAGMQAVVEFDFIEMFKEKDPIDWDGTGTGIAGAGSGFTNAPGNFNNNAETVLDFRSEPLAPWHDKVYTQTLLLGTTAIHVDVGSIVTGISNDMTFAARYQRPDDGSRKYLFASTGFADFLRMYDLDVLQLTLGGVSAGTIATGSEMQPFIDGRAELVVSVTGGQGNCWIDGVLTSASPFAISPFTLPAGFMIYAAINTSDNCSDCEFVRYRVLPTAETPATAFTAPATLDLVYENGQTIDLSGNAIEEQSGWSYPKIIVPGDPPDYSFNGVLDPEGWMKTYTQGMMDNGREFRYLLEPKECISEGGGSPQMVVINGLSFSVADGFTGGHGTGTHFHSSNDPSPPAPALPVPGVAEVGGFFGDENCRGLSEFDLASLPGTITSATLKFQVHDVFPYSGIPVGGLFGQDPFSGTLNVYYYVGNNAEDLGDYTAPETLIAPIIIDPSQAVDDLFSLDVTTALNALLGASAPAMGIRIRQAAEDPNADAITFDRFILEVTYSA